MEFRYTIKVGDVLSYKQSTNTEWCDYLTDGQKYLVINKLSPIGSAFFIMDDNGEQQYMTDDWFEESMTIL